MKKRLFMALQMFAEDPAGTDPAGNDPAGGQNPAGADPKATEPKNEPEKKYTDEDVDRIINQKFAQKFSEWEKKQSKAKDEAEKLAGMNAEQKEKYENEQLKKQVQELLRKDALGKMATVARGMLGEKNISVSDDLIEMLISDDAEKTKSSVDSFITAFQSAVEKAVKDALKGNQPKKTSEPASITKEQIMKVKDPLERQKLINEHMDLFQK
ncbi:DUF4355 domain-containing protein [Sellimonas intestinalis]|uniref:DUF4355 domain-containing protein n=1 Tax=Sellimonas intestinalis TaxID=1653434 RepID=UPI003AB4D264